MTKRGFLQQHSGPRALAKGSKIMAHYRFTGKLTMPADDWRTAARQKDILLMETSPDGVFQSLVRNVVPVLFEEQSESDVNGLAAGLILNMVQQFPLDVRMALVQAIAAGDTMVVLKTEEGIVIDSQQSVDAFPADVAQGAEVKNVQRPSGLVVPV